MTTKKEKAKVEKLLSKLDNQNKEKLKIEKELKDLKNKNILEFGSKIYKELNVNFLEKSEQNNLISELKNIKECMRIMENKLQRKISTKDILTVIKSQEKYNFTMMKKYE